MDCLQGVVVAKVVSKLYIERNNKNIIVTVGRFCEVPSMYYFFKDLCSDVMFLYSCHHQIHNYIEFLIRQPFLQYLSGYGYVRYK